MKKNKLKCLLKNGFVFNPHWRTLLELIIPNLLHNYEEVSNRYVKKSKRWESKLVCRDCGAEDISWSNQPIP